MILGRRFQLERMCEQLGGTWIPAPTSPREEACSRIVTAWFAREMPIAAERPPRPAPTMQMLRCGGSMTLVLKIASGF